MIELWHKPGGLPPEAERRRGEISAAVGEFNAHYSECYKRSRGHEADAKLDTICDEVLRPIELEIIAAAATSLAGLMLKARVVLWCDDGELDDDPDREGWTIDKRVRYSIVRDLCRMQGIDPTPAGFKACYPFEV